MGGFIIVTFSLASRIQRESPRRRDSSETYRSGGPSGVPQPPLPSGASVGSLRPPARGEGSSRKDAGPPR